MFVSVSMCSSFSPNDLKTKKVTSTGCIIKNDVHLIYSLRATFRCRYICLHDACRYEHRLLSAFDPYHMYVYVCAIKKNVFSKKGYSVFKMNSFHRYYVAYLEKESH